MSRARSLLRLLAAVSASLAVSMVPVARAFSEITPAPATAAQMSPARHAGSSVHLAHRMPRVRRPKQSFVPVLPPESGTRLPAGSAARRLVPGRDRPVRAASFALLPDHPPA